MKTSTNTYRGTNHPGDLHEFLDQAIPEQTETKRILARSKLIPPNTLDLPEWEPVRRWSTPSGKERTEDRGTGHDEDRRRLGSTWIYGTRRTNSRGTKSPQKSSACWTKTKPPPERRERDRNKPAQQARTLPTPTSPEPGC